MNVAQRIAGLDASTAPKLESLRRVRSEQQQLENKILTAQTDLLQLNHKLTSLQGDVAAIKTDQLMTKIETDAAADFSKAMAQKHALEGKIEHFKGDKQCLRAEHQRLIERDNEHRQLISAHFENTGSATQSRQLTAAIANFNFAAQLKDVMIKRQALTKTKVDSKQKIRQIDDSISRIDQHRDALRKKLQKIQQELSFLARSGEAYISSDPNENRLVQKLNSLRTANRRLGEESRALGAQLKNATVNAAPAIVKRKPPPVKAPDIDDIWE